MEENKNNKKKYELLQKIEHLASNKAYLKRRQQSAKIRQIAQDERIKTIIHKVDNYINKINNKKPSLEEKLRQQAVDEYLEEKQKKADPGKIN